MKCVVCAICVCIALALLVAEWELSPFADHRIGSAKRVSLRHRELSHDRNFPLSLISQLKNFGSDGYFTLQSSCFNQSFNQQLINRIKTKNTSRHLLVKSQSISSSNKQIPVIFEVNDWDSHKIVTAVAAILAKEILMRVRCSFALPK